jgi:hypothetical protein
VYWRVSAALVSVIASPPLVDVYGINGKPFAAIVEQSYFKLAALNLRVNDPLMSVNMHLARASHGLVVDSRLNPAYIG